MVLKYAMLSSGRPFLNVGDPTKLLPVVMDEVVPFFWKVDKGWRI